MDSVITEYQKWKEQGESLRAKAMLAMESRFHEILTEAVEIAHLYRQDFGAPLKPPTVVTAFKFKSNVKAKTKKPAAKPAKTPAPAAKVERPDAPKAETKADNPQLTSMRKRLEQTKKKLDAARAAGQNTKNLDDKIYELEDTIHLAEIA